MARWHLFQQIEIEAGLLNVTPGPLFSGRPGGSVSNSGSGLCAGRVTPDGRRLRWNMPVEMGV
jgi:hypothetical protein